jgi:hypothetical protein
MSPRRVLFKTQFHYNQPDKGGLTSLSEHTPARRRGEIALGLEF